MEDKQKRAVVKSVSASLEDELHFWLAHLLEGDFDEVAGIVCDKLAKKFPKVT